MKKLDIRDMCYIAVYTALISVISQINIPMPSGVPTTLQTFIIPLGAVILGTRNGTIASVIYVILGMLGVPVFTGMSGGLQAAFGATGGFILSFPLLTLFTGLGYDLALKMLAAKKKVLYILTFTIGILTGTVINYIAGMMWFSFVTGNSLSAAFIMCVAPFIATTVMKIVLVELVGPTLRRAMISSGLLFRGQSRNSNL